MLRLNHWASRSRPHTAAAALILATGIIIISILPEISLIICWPERNEIPVWLENVGSNVPTYIEAWYLLRQCIIYCSIWLVVSRYLSVYFAVFVSIAHLWTGRAICYSVPEMSGLSVWHGGQGGWRRARELWHGQNILPLNIIQQQRCQNILRNIAQ